MGDALKNLISAAGPAICAGHADGRAKAELFLKRAGTLGKQLETLLESKNGFFAFENALLVRSLDWDRPPFGIVQWNQNSLWKSRYRIDIKEAIFFAEDAFGGQFGFIDGSIRSFDPENGEMTSVADDLESWAEWVLQNHRVRTGWPLMQQWQRSYGEIENGQRLVPKVPFVLGGKFSLDNLYKLEDVEAMRLRASIANQLYDCPPGTEIILKTTSGDTVRE